MAESNGYSNKGFLKPEILDTIERITAQMWPGTPVIPVMSTGATDGLYLRNAGIPTYGISGFFEDVGDTRAHGRDERRPGRRQRPQPLVRHLGTNVVCRLHPQRRRNARQRLVVGQALLAS